MTSVSYSTRWQSLNLEPCGKSRHCVHMHTRHGWSGARREAWGGRSLRWAAVEGRPGRTEPSVLSVKPPSAHIVIGLKAVTIDPEKFYIRDKDHKVLVLDSGTLTAVPDKTYILPGDSLALSLSLSAVFCPQGTVFLLGLWSGCRTPLPLAEPREPLGTEWQVCGSDQI